MHEQVAQQVAGEHGGRQGPGPQADAPLGERLEIFDGTASVAIGGQGERDEGMILARDPQFNRPGEHPGHERPTPWGLGPPGPERGLEPFPLPGQGRNRVVLAPQAISRPIAGKRGVVHRLEPGQMCQQVRGEPEECRRLADPPERDLDVPRAPLGLDLAAGLGEPKANAVRCLATTDHPGPEVVEDRVGDERAERRAGAIGERGEEGLVLHGLVFVRDLAGPHVERDGRGQEPVAVAARDADARPLGDVIVDDQVEANGPSPPGQAGDGEVLDPDAGVEQLGLVAGDDEPRGLVGHVGPVEPRVGVVALRQGDDLGASH